MNEDPVFYKKLSKLIRETIEEYHIHRISESEFLKRAQEHEDSFLNGQRRNVQSNLKDNPTGRAYFNLITEVFKDHLEGKTDVAAEMAEGIDTLIREIVFEKGQLIIDWQKNSDIEGRIKIAIDDYLYDLKLKYGIELPFELIDQMVLDGLTVAKLKFV